MRATQRFRPAQLPETRSAKLIGSERAPAASLPTCGLVPLGYQRRSFSANRVKVQHEGIDRDQVGNVTAPVGQHAGHKARRAIIIHLATTTLDFIASQRPALPRAGPPARASLPFRFGLDISAMIVGIWASAKRSLLLVGLPAEAAVLRCVEPQVGNRALHDQTAYHRCPLVYDAAIHCCCHVQQRRQLPALLLRDMLASTQSNVDLMLAACCVKVSDVGLYRGLNAARCGAVP